MNGKLKKPKSKSALELRIVKEERLHKARQSFKLALGTTVVFTFISLTGLGVVLTGGASVGKDITTSGMAAIVSSIQFVKDSGDKLEKILAELNDED